MEGIIGEYIKEVVLKNHSYFRAGSVTHFVLPSGAVIKRDANGEYSFGGIDDSNGVAFYIRFEPETIVTRGRRTASQNPTDTVQARAHLVAYAFGEYDINPQNWAAAIANLLRVIPFNGYAGPGTDIYLTVTGTNSSEYDVFLEETKQNLQSLQVFACVSVSFTLTYTPNSTCDVCTDIADICKQSTIPLIPCNCDDTGGGGGGGINCDDLVSCPVIISLQNSVITLADTKVAANSAVTGATKTKITYDSKGLVTAGTDATTADIADSTDRRYVTDAQRTVIQNTSGTNTGNETTGSIATINHAASAKTTPVDADEITGQDSASSFSLMRVTFLNLYNYIKAKLDAVYITTSIIKLTGDQTITSTSNTNITDWVFAATANKNYDVEGWIRIDDSGAAGGVKFAITIPTGATIDVNLFGTTNGNTAVSSQRLTASGTLNGTAFVSEAQGRYVFFRGEINIGSTAGNIQWQQANASTSQSSVIKKLGSSFYITPTN